MVITFQFARQRVRHQPLLPPSKPNPRKETHESSALLAGSGTRPDAEGRPGTLMVPRRRTAHLSCHYGLHLWKDSWAPASSPRQELRLGLAGCRSNGRVLPASAVQPAKSSPPLPAPPDSPARGAPVSPLGDALGVHQAVALRPVNLLLRKAKRTKARTTEHLKLACRRGTHCDSGRRRNDRLHPSRQKKRTVKTSCKYMSSFSRFSRELRRASSGLYGLPVLRSLPEV